MLEYYKNIYKIYIYIYICLEIMTNCNDNVELLYKICIKIKH